MTILSGVKQEHREYQHQPDATLDEDDPVSGQKYTILETTKDVKIYSLVAKSIWSEQPSPLEIHVTIDGNTITFTKANPASNEFYEADRQANLAESAQSLNAMGISRYVAQYYQGKSIKIEAEVTGGTVSNLSTRIKWAKKV